MVTSKDRQARLGALTRRKFRMAAERGEAPVILHRYAEGAGASLLAYADCAPQMEVVAEVLARRFAERAAAAPSEPEMRARWEEGPAFDPVDWLLVLSVAGHDPELPEGFSLPDEEMASYALWTWWAWLTGIEENSEGLTAALSAYRSAFDRLDDCRVEHEAASIPSLVSGLETPGDPCRPALETLEARRADLADAPLPG